MRIDSGVSTPRGARGAPKAKPPRPSRAVAKGGHVECGEGRARPRDVSMLQGTSPPPRLAVVQNAAFSRENHRGGGRVRFPRDASPRDGPTSPDEPRSPARGSPGAHAPTRAEPPRPPSPPAAAPPTRRVADRASLDPKRALVLARLPRNRVVVLLRNSFAPNVPASDATRPIRRAEPRPADGVRAVHRDRAPRAAVDARAAPRRARARARRPGERAETRRSEQKKKVSPSRTRARAFGRATVATRRAP